MLVGGYQISEPITLFQYVLLVVVVVVVAVLAAVELVVAANIE